MKLRISSTSNAAAVATALVCSTVFAICDHVGVLCFIHFVPYLLFLSVFLSYSEIQSVFINLFVCHRLFGDPKTRFRKTVPTEHNASNNCYAVWTKKAFWYFSIVILIIFALEDLTFHSTCRIVFFYNVFECYKVVCLEINCGFLLFLFTH